MLVRPEDVTAGAKASEPTEFKAMLKVPAVTGTPNTSVVAAGRDVPLITPVSAVKAVVVDREIPEAVVTDPLVVPATRVPLAAVHVTVEVAPRNTTATEQPEPPPELQERSATNVEADCATIFISVITGDCPVAVKTAAIARISLSDVPRRYNPPLKDSVPGPRSLTYTVTGVFAFEPLWSDKKSMLSELIVPPGFVVEFEMNPCTYA